MSLPGPEALVHAAEQQEALGNWRHAYGFWCEVIAKYGNAVSSSQLSYWEMHRDMCDRKMK